MIIWGLTLIFSGMIVSGTYQIIDISAANALLEPNSWGDVNGPSTAGWWAMAVCGAVGLAIHWLWVLCARIANIMGIKKWEAFKEANSLNFPVAISVTKTVLSDEKLQGAFIDGSVEKTEVGKVVAARIEEWRDAVNHFNTTVASMRAIRDMGWILPGRLVMPEIPASLSTITMESNQVV